MEITEYGFSYTEYSLHNIHDDDNCDDDNVNKNSNDRVRFQLHWVQSSQYPQRWQHDNCDDDNVKKKMRMTKYNFSYTEYSLHNIHREMEVRRGIDSIALKVQ